MNPKLLLLINLNCTYHNLIGQFEVPYGILLVANVNKKQNHMPHVTIVKT